ncbi:MAG TPA: response regulator [Bryobacteraceae bacterium]|jgi:CheY-like chemotaxis protein|nr:response regulator [Bryobacteraceae bacterium]
MPTQTKRFEILVAEDSPDDVELVRQALKEHQVDCVLHVTHDGAHAITIIDSLDADPQAPPLDLLLLDMHLPRRDGKEILTRLRSSGRYAETPVIVMTGSLSSVVEEKAARHAPVVYFQKPSSLDEFMQFGKIIRGVLDGQRGVPETPSNGKSLGGGV